MNCKQGDLAVIASVLHADERRYLGGLLRVIDINAAQSQRHKETYWNFEPMSALAASAPRRTVRDASLRPIRDPGKDAQDETLSWLPVPQEVVSQ